MADKYKGHLGMDVWRRDKKRYDESFGPLSTTAEIEVAIQKLYSSVLWYYPVHKYIGDIVQHNKFSVDFQPEQKWKWFQWYCETISEFMACLKDCTVIAAVVLRALPGGLPSRPTTAAWISEKEAIYVLATYNLECFDYLLRSFAIGLKQNCLGFVEKQLQEMIEKRPLLEDLKEPLTEFVSKQSRKLLEEQEETVKRIERICKNRWLCGIQHITPLSFIMSEEINPKKISPPPKDPKSWEDYFLQVCSERLALSLAKEKEQWEADSSDSSIFLRPWMEKQLAHLEEILKKPSENYSYKFNKGTTSFREEVSRLISEQLH